MRSGLLLSALLASACGTGKPQIPPELIGAGGNANNPSADYPSGPYGIEVGSIVENFQFQGFVQPELDKTLETIDFAQFYDPKGEKNHELLLLNTAAAWCQPCRIEHASLPGRAEEFAPQGLVIFALLFQDSDGEPATEETLDLWTSNFGTSFPMALDPSFQMGRYASAETPPLNLVVDARTMKILRLFIGNQDEALWDFIATELAERSKD